MFRGGEGSGFDGSFDRLVSEFGEIPKSGAAEGAGTGTGPGDEGRALRNAGTSSAWGTAAGGDEGLRGKGRTLLAWEGLSKGSCSNGFLSMNRVFFTRQSSLEIS